MWSDNETTVDLLDFSHLRSGILSLVRDERLLPATIGVFGDWGSGKSSLLEMVKSDLEEESGTLCITFNGWLFDGYEDAKSALMSTILHEIGNKADLPDRAKAIVKNLCGRVDKMKLAGLTLKHGLAFALGGPAALGLSAGGDALATIRAIAEKAGSIDVEKIQGVLKDSSITDAEVRKDVLEFRKDFGRLIEESAVDRMVVIIDDLDRCTPDRIIETLEAIKLFLYVPNTAFLIGADERLVKDAVRRRFPDLPGERSEVGRDYLEKLIQFPVRIPPLDMTEMSTYIGLLFLELSGVPGAEQEKARVASQRRDQSQLYKATFGLSIAQDLFADLPAELAESLSIAEQIAPILGKGLNGNPRQCKRFLNTLLVRLAMAESKGIALSRQVLAKLMLLEYFRPEFFRSLAASVIEENGRSADLTAMEGRISKAEPRGKGRCKSKATSKSSVTEDVDDTVLSLSFQPWLEDSFTHEWLDLSPAISAMDLRPYFFFSRDALRTMGQALQRLSPVAQEVLSGLLHKSDGVRRRAQGQASNLSDAEASSVFEELAARSERSEDLSLDNSALAGLVDLAVAKPGILPQVTGVLDRLPESSLPMGVVPRLQKIPGADGSSVVKTLLGKWANGKNRTLASAATSALRPRRSSSSRKTGKGMA